MTESTLTDPVSDAVERADGLLASGQVREAIDLLTRANRSTRDVRLERALVRVRKTGCRTIPAPVPAPREPLRAATAAADGLVEVSPADMNIDSFRRGLATSGCLLVRGLVPPERAKALTVGIDAALASYDAAEAGDEARVDPAWYSPFPVPDRMPADTIGAAIVGQPLAPSRGHMPDRRRRKFIREDGGLWTANSPRMLFELLELVDEVGVGPLMQEHLGERPYLSVNKCTLRRVPPVVVNGGWHQDGAFLGGEVGAFNFWVALSKCGRDAPGLDIVAKRFEQVLEPGEGAQFNWSLSDDGVQRAAAGAPIVRPVFEAGDALLFDHLLVHRTAASTDMTLDRYAIESWFFAPSAFPPAQLPVVY